MFAYNILGAVTGSSATRRASIGAALAAALAASSCCIGPLVLAALGVGGAGAFAALAVYRPWILGATGILIAVGFYLTYRKPVAVEGDDCGCERPKTARAGKIGLWIATVIVVLIAAAPTLIAKVFDSHRVAADSSARTTTAVIHVEGADCEACAAHIRVALDKVGGFHALALDVPSQRITVTYEPTPGRLDAYVAAIDHLGYEAALDPTNRPVR